MKNDTMIEKERKLEAASLNFKIVMMAEEKKKNDEKEERCESTCFVRRLYR